MTDTRTLTFPDSEYRYDTGEGGTFWGDSPAALERMAGIRTGLNGSSWRNVVIATWKVEWRLTTPSGIWPRPLSGGEPAELANVRFQLHAPAERAPPGGRAASGLAGLGGLVVVLRRLVRLGRRRQA